MRKNHTYEKDDKSGGTEERLSDNSLMEWVVTIFLLITISFIFIKVLFY